jgi:hypothetical protein
MGALTHVSSVGVHINGGTPETRGISAEAHLSKGPGRLTNHHRKPGSLGGKKINGNISRVPRREHEAWHRLFDNLEAPVILEKLKGFLVTFSAVATEGELLTPGRVSKQRLAWEILFRDMIIDEILVVINSVWIDPDYELILIPNGTLRCVWRKKGK